LHFQPGGLAGAEAAFCFLVSALRDQLEHGQHSSRDHSSRQA
jgi:hypothetical protein